MSSQGIQMLQSLQYSPSFSRSLSGFIYNKILFGLDVTVSQFRKPVTSVRPTCKFNMERVFVYGTLKKGQPNYFHFEKKEHGVANFISKGVTVEHRPLIIASRYNIPMLLDMKGKGKQVYGELYEVDEIMLSVLDKLEVHPDLYVREKVLIQLLNKSSDAAEGPIVEGPIVEAWCYLMKTFHDHLLDSPMYANYNAFDGRGLEYVSSYKREQTTESINKREFWLEIGPFNVR